MRARAWPALVPWAALVLAGCSFALDFSPDVLLPPLDAVGDEGGARDTNAMDVAADLGASDCDGGCPGSMSCIGGVCRRCAASEVACGTMCVDLQSSDHNCGGCDVRCGPGATHCCGGACTSSPHCP